MIEELKPYESYQASQIAWAPRLPEHWTVRRAKTLFDRVKRPVQHGAEVVTCFRDGTVTLRSKRRLTGYTEAIFELGYQGIRRGDLVIHAMDAFAGAVGVSDSDGKASPVYAACVPRDQSVPAYYALVIRQMAHSQWILALAKGIRERSTDFRFEVFGTQLVPVSPPDEQAAIVRFLDHANRRIDQFIRTKKKLISLLNEQKQAIIHRAVTRGLDPDVKLKDSGVPWLGAVPEHWEVRKLGSLFRRVGSGTTPAGDSYYGVGVNWLMTGDLNDRVVSTTKRTVTRRAISEIGALKLYPPASLVVAMYGATIGKTGITGSECCTNQACCVFAEPLPNALVSYIQRVMIVSRSHLIELGKGGGQPNVNADIVRRFKVPVPPKSEQQAILEFLAKELAPIETSVASTTSEITLMGEYRTRLISDVVTGQLDVRAAAAGLPAIEPEAALTEPEGDETDIEDGEAA